MENTVTQKKASQIMAEKTAKEKMLDLIKNKQSGGRSKTMADPKNDVKNMRKGPKIFN